MHLQHLYRYVARWYQRVISQDGTLQRRQLRERALLFKITLVMSVLSCLVAIPMFTDADEKVIHLTSVTMFLSSGLFVLYRLTTLRSISKTMLCCIVVVLTVGLMCADLANRPRYNTDWPMFVIIIDMALVLRLPRSVSIGVTCLVVFWISLTQLEAFFRFGLFDLPGMSSQSHRREYVTDMMECETLPCPQEDAVPVVTSGLTMIFVFVADFVCTRGFAEGLKREQETMERTVGTVEEIALLLAGYDVDRVAQILSAKRDELSPEIFVALQTIERNLRSYLAYLPKTCLPTQDIEEDVEELGATATMCDDSVLGSVCEDVAQSVVGSSVSLGSPPMDAFSPTMFHAQSRANNHSFTHPSTMLKLHERSSTTRPAVGLLTPVKATVLIVNTCQHESLFHVENDTQNFARFFGQILQATLAAVGEKRGMVDVFVGDVVFCSFNASRRCGLHATAALCAAKAIANVPRTKPLSPASRQDDRVVSIGVAGGKAICGDLGCAEMRRFSVLGRVAVEAVGLERAARTLGLNALCNEQVQRDTECLHPLRLVPRRVLVKRGNGGSRVERLAEGGVADGFFVYEVLLDAGGGGGSGGGAAAAAAVGGGIAQEWLYEMQDTMGLTNYNAGVKAFLAGENWAAAMQKAVGDGAEGERPPFASTEALLIQL